MTREELIELLETLPQNAEIMVDLGVRYAEVKDVRVEYSQRVSDRKPYVIIDLYR